MTYGLHRNHFHLSFFLPWRVLVEMNWILALILTDSPKLPLHSLPMASFECGVFITAPWCWDRPSLPKRGRSDIMQILSLELKMIFHLLLVNLPFSMRKTCPGKGMTWGTKSISKKQHHPDEAKQNQPNSNLYSVCEQ